VFRHNGGNVRMMMLNSDWLKAARKRKTRAMEIGVKIVCYDNGFFTRARK